MPFCIATNTVDDIIDVGNVGLTIQMSQSNKVGSQVVIDHVGRLGEPCDPAVLVSITRTAMCEPHSKIQILPCIMMMQVSAVT